MQHFNPRRLGQRLGNLPIQSVESLYLLSLVTRLQSALAITDGQNPVFSIRYSRRSGIVGTGGRLGTL